MSIQKASRWFIALYLIIFSFTEVQALAQHKQQEMTPPSAYANFGTSRQRVPFHYQWDLAACLIFQNEADYLKEWIEFHKLLGVQHFYLLNHLSTDHYLSVLTPYIDAGVVELIDWPYAPKTLQEWDAIQCHAYTHVIQLAKSKVKWLAILDSDEFLFPTQGDSLIDYLSAYEEFDKVGGVKVNWVVFGTSWVKKIPNDKLLIETLVLSSGAAAEHVKSIVRPERVAYCVSPHYVHYHSPFHHVNASSKMLSIDVDQIRINHYWSRDEYFLYQHKIPRRIQWGTPKEVCELWGQAANNIYDPSILRFVPNLRQRMGLDP